MYSHVTADIRNGSGGGGAPAYDPSETFNLAADGNHVVTAGLLGFISVKNAAGLAALNIGTTPGGTELVNAAVITAGEEITFSIGQYNAAGIILYITGITSNTTFNLYKF